MKNVAE